MATHVNNKYSIEALCSKALLRFVNKTWTACLKLGVVSRVNTQYRINRSQFGL